MIDYVNVLQAESSRFGELLAADLRADVPSCPEWTLADLAWHLTEVQHFWATIAGALLDDPGKVDSFERPERDGDLPALFAAQSQALLDAVTTRSPDDACWSWDSNGGTVAWVRRRQAHEALIHRFDAELAARALHAPLDAELAADGVDEILRSMLTGVPDWGTFTPDGMTARFETIDTGHRWDAQLGRFTGTSPNTGTTHDLDAMELVDVAGASVSATISAPAAELDLWLWGRGDPGRLHIAGDRRVAERIRRQAAEGTQ